MKPSSSAVPAEERVASGRDPARSVLCFAAGIAVLGILLLFLMIIAFALPVFTEQSAGGPFSRIWAPGQGQFGIQAMIAGSLVLALSALCIGWPFGLVLCCWLFCPVNGQSGFARSARSIVGFLVRIMTAIPTVVYGFAAVFLLTPLVRETVGGTGFCWLSAALMLAVLILPTIVLLLSAGLAPRLERLLPGGLALGFTRMDLMWFFVLPEAKKTLFSSLVLGFGRAVGDTLIPLMLAGNAPQMPYACSAGLRTLTAHMAMVTSNEVGGAAYNSLFMAGALLLLINALVSLCACRQECSSRKERKGGRR